MTPYLQHRTLYPALIEKPPDPQLGLVVVIPAYDEPQLIDSLQSLSRCHPPHSKVEVIVIVNHSAAATETIKTRNQQYFEQAREWAENHTAPCLQFHLIYCPDLPAKQAGVGMARKIGMDEACRRLEQIGNPRGVILGFDADSHCDPDYFQKIEAYFNQYSKVKAAGIYFEHPLTGPEFDAATYEAVTLYELHLRYFINSQAWAGLPYAYQTIGSSMAVRCEPYQKQGGMNRRKAGEDFYFLHKFTQLGHFGTVNSTRVIPSPRSSHRVPFGTGRAVGELLKNDLECTTYAPDSFVILKPFIRQVAQLARADYQARIAAPLLEFLNTVNWEERLAEIRKHTSSQAAFCKRFFQWFDAFMLMKYVHFMRDHHLPNVPVQKAACRLAEVSGYSTGRQPTAKDLLLLWRSIDRAKTLG